MNGQSRMARDHQQTAGSRVLASQGYMFYRGRGDAKAGSERCNILKLAEGVWRTESRSGKAIKEAGTREQPIAEGDGRPENR